MHILFICSQNRWRSLTAEHIFAGYQGLITRSAGTSPNARIKVNAADLNWADLIVVMENKHLDYLKRKFSQLMAKKKTLVLHIPDRYRYMDEELIQLLKAKLAEILEA